MKKTTKLFSLALVALMSAVMVSCDDPEPTPTPEPEPTPEQGDPTVSVTAGEVGEDWISFTITTTNVKRAFYVAVEKELMPALEAEEGFDLTEFVLSAPNMVMEPNTAWSTVFEGRRPNTTYLVYAAGFQGDKKVLSECVEMTTLAHQYATTALPNPTSCDVNHATLTTVDSYKFTLANEDGSLNFSFNVLTEKDSNGVIPTGEYKVGTFVAAGVIELTNISLEVDGLPMVISEGALDIEMYDDGAKIRLDGEFVIVSGDSVTLSYDGAVALSGLGGGDTGTLFTAATNLTSAEGMEGVEAGWHEIQFFPVAESATVLDVSFHSNPNKKYLTAGTYYVCESQDSANAMGCPNNWIGTTSFYQENITPYSIVAGKDSYVEVVTRMDEGTDYYELTFSLKIRSMFDQSETVLKGTYKGALGFVAQVEEEESILEMAQYYVSITSDGNTHTLNFFGPVPTIGMTVVVEGALPEVGGDYVWYDIVSGSFFDYIMAQDDPSLGDAPLLEGSRIAIKRFKDGADASDEGIVKPFYGFKLEASVEGYDIVGDWKSFEDNIAAE